MTSSLYRELCDYLIELDIFLSEDRRKAIAYYAVLDRRLLSQIQFSGSSGDFILSTIRLLMEYGKLETGEDSLVAFLGAVKPSLGKDRESSIQEFIRRWIELNK